MRILFSFTLLFALALGQASNTNSSSFDIDQIQDSLSQLMPSVTCVQKNSTYYGSAWWGTYYNDWGVLQREEVWNQTLKLANIKMCQNITSLQMVGLSASAAQIDATDPKNPKTISTFPLRTAGNVDDTLTDIACSNYSLSVDDFIKEIDLVIIDSGISKIVFYSTNGKMFGSRLTQGEVQQNVKFQPNNQLIGFYGTAYPTLNMTSLGFLTYQEQCRKYNPTEKALAVTGAVFATIGVILLIVLVCCGLPIFGCCYVRKRRPDLMNKVKMPQQINKLMPKKFQDERCRVVPDSSMAADVEMTDNNIDDKSGIMTEEQPKGNKK